jgi:hypothetical protein
MPYGKVDELAINTIRTLAVRLPLLLCSSFHAALPHHEATPPSQQSFFYST